MMDLITISSAAFVASGVVYTILEGRNQSRLRRQATDRQLAHDETVNDITISQLKTAVHEQTKALQRAVDSITRHDRECIAFKTDMMATQKQLTSITERHERAIDQLQSQVRMVVSGGSDKIIEIK